MIFDGFAPHSKLWQFVGSKELNNSENSELDSLLESFIKSWQAHGKPLRAAYKRENRIITVSVDALAENASGCSIDKLNTLFNEFGVEYNVDFMDKMWLVSDQGDFVHGVKDEGLFGILEGKRILNLSVASLEDWQKHGYVPMENSWVSNRMG